MIILGVVLLVLGFLTGISIVWMLGIVALVIGAVLIVSGRSGHRLAGRSHWY